HYYVTLSDKDKHEVWQEFYDANQHTPYQKLFQRQSAAHTASQPPVYQPAPREAMQPVVVDHTPATPASHTSHARRQPRHNKPRRDNAPTRLNQNKILSKISANGKLKAKHPLQSLGFGLATGLAVIVLFLFTFFNQYIIAPFIQPSRTVTNT